MSSWVINLVITILKGLINTITPEIRKEIEVFVLGLYEKAHKTPNPADDILVGMLFAILGLKTPI